MNDRQTVFVAEYLKDFNATRAAKAAGYSAKTARAIGSRLLTDVDIQEAIKAEIAGLQAELNQATGEAKAKLQVKVIEAKAKLQAMQNTVQAGIEVSERETEVKIKSLREQAARAQGEQKARLESRIAPDLLPTMDEGGFILDYWMPAGTSR